MTQAQKEIQQALLNDEKAVLKQLREIYTQASQDCADKIAALNARTDMQNLQSIIYQKQYQEALKAQIDGILTNLQSDEYSSISEYLASSYTNGYAGTMYQLQQAGIPVIVPIDQSKVASAIQTDSKISTDLYTRLGEDVTKLKTSIASEVSRGIANGSTWLDVASNIATGMNSPYKTAMSNAMRIARTESGRITSQANLDAAYAAKEKGADSLKQWNATLDGRTRPDHAAADGQIRELDEYFNVGGEKLKAPCVGGSARNVCNCRCCMNTLPRWTLDETELERLQSRAAYYGLDKTADFEDFKNKYLQATAESDTIELIISDEAQKLVDIAEKYGVKYREVQMHDTPLNESKIIEALSGGDQTGGSCASVGLCYIGQKGGMNVLDFRGGNSANLFAQRSTLDAISELPDAATLKATAKTPITAANNLLKQVEIGKEYYFYAGRHAAIVRKADGDILQYLELQSATQSGWTNFDGNPRYTLAHRFGCSSSNKWSKYGIDSEATMIEVDSLKDSADLRKLLGYINTASDAQKKGSDGYAK